MKVNFWCKTQHCWIFLTYSLFLRIKIRLNPTCNDSTSKAKPCLTKGLIANSLLMSYYQCRRHLFERFLTF